MRYLSKIHAAHMHARLQPFFFERIMMQKNPYFYARKDLEES